MNDLPAESSRKILTPEQVARGLGILAPEDYRVGRVQEYDHFAEEARQVRD